MNDTLDPIEVETNVADSARLLDTERPGWHDQINLDTLDMRYEKQCIAGQLNLKALNPDEDDVVFPESISFSYKRGFCLPPEAEIEGFSNLESWEHLTKLWKEEIFQRQI